MAAKRTPKTQQGLVVFAKNKRRVSSFYQQALALTVEETASSHDLLRGGGYEVVREVAEWTGGYLKPLEGAWHFRGCVVLDGWDPEGNVVQFKQRDV
jgi:catechol-2,3-dioxygenase